MQYENGETCPVCGHAPILNGPATSPPSALPSEIIPGFLFLGSYDHASRQDMLVTLGIEYVLNVCQIIRFQFMYGNTFV